MTITALTYSQYIHGSTNPSPVLWKGDKANYPATPEPQSDSIPPLPFETWRPAFSNQIAHLYEDITGQRVIKLEYPGGSNRNVCRLHLANNETVIACQRATPHHQELEERVLHHLAPHTQTVPGIVYANPLLFFQEDRGTQRLSQIADTATTEQLAQLLDQALSSIHRIHTIASANGLDYQVPLLGCEENWIERFIAMPVTLSKLINKPCKRPDITLIRDILTPVRPRFIKWDTRLGNAMTSENHDITWIDWEHCGARNRLDDLAVLLCDEGTPDNVDVENWLIKKHLPHFADGKSLTDALTYLRIFGVLHMIARLILILNRQKAKEQWFSKQFVLEGDYISMTKEHALCLSSRATRWAKAEPLLDQWSEWFTCVTHYINSETAPPSD